MNDPRELALMLKGLILEAPEEDQRQIHAAMGKIKAVVAEYGANGSFAVAIVGAEIAAQD